MPPSITTFLCSNMKTAHAGGERLISLIQDCCHAFLRVLFPMHPSLFSILA